MKYTEEYEQTNAKGSFPAMITPGYQAAKQANSLASNVRHLSDAVEFFWTLIETRKNKLGQPKLSQELLS